MSLLKITLVSAGLILLWALPAGAQNGPMPSILQSATGQITITAANADFMEMLQALFKTVGKQFTLDDKLGGTATLRLINQPFSVVLDALCGQEYVTYQIDPRGIYHFRQNREALSSALLRIHFVSLLQQSQLQAMPQSKAAGGGTGVGMSGGLAAKALPPGWRQLSIAPSSLSAYDLMLRQNGLVGIDIPAGHSIPVAEALRRFSLQSGAAITLAPSIAGNEQFRIDGHIERPLPQALALLAKAAHLSITELNGAYFVTTAPDFNLFFTQGAKNPAAAGAPPENKKTGQ